MTNTMMKILSIPELEANLASIGAYECRIHIYGYEDDESSEDPIMQIFGIAEAVKWIKDNPAYSYFGELTGYMIIAFGDDGNYIETIIF